MKILLYGINFAPELTGVGKYTGEMAAWLAAHGHEVRVVAAPPYYPTWRVGANYSAWAWLRECWQGVTVWRCPLWVPSRPGGIKRLLHLGSFAISSLPVMVAQMLWRPNVVWVVAPPLFCAPAAILLARLSGAKAWLHVQDFEVDAAFDMGLLKGRTLRRWVATGEGWLMRRFDRVSTISARMLERSVAKGVEDGRSVYFPNWVDISAIAPLTGPSSYRKELGVPPDVVVALYSGNMGAKQGLEVLAEVAKLLRNTPAIAFVFCGNGPDKDDLRRRCEGLANIRFLDLQPLERFNELLALADIHLLPQRADAADLVLPSKLTGMLASGRAVIATAAPGTELANVIGVAASCGLVIPPENAPAMAAAIRHLACDPALRAQLGARGRRYAERRLARDSVLRQFEKDLRTCVVGN